MIVTACPRLSIALPCNPAGSLGRLLNYPKVRPSGRGKSARVTPHDARMLPFSVKGVWYVSQPMLLPTDNTPGWAAGSSILAWLSTVVTRNAMYRSGFLSVNQQYSSATKTSPKRAQRRRRTIFPTFPVSTTERGRAIPKEG